MDHIGVVAVAKLAHVTSGAGQHALLEIALPAKTAPYRKAPVVCHVLFALRASLAAAFATAHFEIVRCILTIPRCEGSWVSHLVTYGA